MTVQHSSFDFYINTISLPLSVKISLLIVYYLWSIFLKRLFKKIIWPSLKLLHNNLFYVYFYEIKEENVYYIFFICIEYCVYPDALQNSFTISPFIKENIICLFIDRSLLMQPIVLNSTSYWNKFEIFQIDFWITSYIGFCCVLFYLFFVNVFLFDILDSRKDSFKNYYVSDIFISSSVYNLSKKKQSNKRGIYFASINQSSVVIYDECHCPVYYCHVTVVMIAHVCAFMYIYLSFTDGCSRRGEIYKVLIYFIYFLVVNLYVLYCKQK